MAGPSADPALTATRVCDVIGVGFQLTSRGIATDQPTLASQHADPRKKLDWSDPFNRLLRIMREALVVQRVK